MKNIFLVQTDKPSRLVKIKDTFFLTSTDDIPGGTFYNISITNTEEIKEGYYLDLTHNIVMKSVFYPSSDKNCKKIILTDDPDLIKDGVQAIDDDFLEWFVQNSDCEEVEVKWVKTPDGIFYHKDNVPYGYYKIIIPKEELSKDEIDKFFVDMVCNPKEEPKQEFPQLGTKEFNNLASAYFGGKPQEDPKQYPIGGYAPGNYTCTCITCKERFFGDKRAVQCEPCAIEMVNAEIDINKEGCVEENKQEPNFYEKLKEYFKTTPREKVLEDWNKSAEFDKVDPTVDEFIENSNKEIFKNLKTISSKDIDPEFVDIVNDNFGELIGKELKEETKNKCVYGCKHYYGGEIKHDKDCIYYPESLSEMYDNLKLKSERMHSEEEVLNFTQTMIQQYKFGNTNIEQMDLLKETLQQFKNK